jgi:long-chain fatty acid transport protein
MYALTKDPKTIANSVNDSKFALEGEGGGYNWNAGILLKPSERFQFGLAYRSKTDVDYIGEVKFTHAYHLAGALSKAMPSSQDGETTLHLPATINAGILYRFSDAWDASADVNFVRWSTYDKLVIDLEDNLPVDFLVQEKNWDDTVVFRLGTSYRMSDITILRGGFLYDQSPVPDETIDAQLPDNNRLGFSLGFGRKVGKFDLDFSYMFLKFMDRDKDNNVGYTDVTNEFPPTATSKKDGIANAADQSMLNTMRGVTYPVGNGTYKSHANLLSVSASIKF